MKEEKYKMTLGVPHLNGTFLEDLTIHKYSEDGVETYALVRHNKKGCLRRDNENGPWDEIVLGTGSRLALVEFLLENYSTEETP